MATNRIVLDSGALSALAKKGRPIRLILRAALANDVEVVVPAVVVAESTSGDSGRDAQVNRVLKATRTISIDARIGRAAGSLRHALRRRHAGTIDAIVVACADDVVGSLIVTADLADLGPLAAERGRSRVVSV